MKQKFKEGDKVKVISLKQFPQEGDDWMKRAKLRIGNIVTVSDSIIDDGRNIIQVNSNGYYLDSRNFELYNEPKTLTIKKLTRTRAGKKYFTTQFSVKGKIVGHQHNSKQGRDKSLKNFIKYIQENDFRII